jgi:hypothetical protein
MRTWVIVTVVGRVLAGWICVLFLLALIMYYGAGIKGASLYTSITGDIGFLDYLYFAIVSGTTLGYGDYVPLGWFRIVATIDALSGIVMGGVLVATLTSELFDPLLAVRRAEGMWFKGGILGKLQDPSSRSLFTIFVIRKIGRDWLCDGRNFDSDGKYKHRFDGKVIALEKNALYVTYQNDATATEDFTSGLWILHLTSGTGDILSYNGYGFDHVHGQHDASGGFHIDKVKDAALFRGLRTRDGSEEFKTAFSEAKGRL